MRSLLLAATAATTFACAAHAQRLAVYDPTVGMIAECQPASLLLPGPVPPIGMYPQVPPLPPMAPPAGDSTFDNTLGHHWVTNGVLLAAQPTPEFPPLGPLPPPVPIPPAALAAIGGMATGIAVDSVAGVMFFIGPGGVCLGLTVPVLAPAVPPFAMPFPIAAPPITGLDWDSGPGTLSAGEAGGCPTTFPPGGPPAAPPLPPPVPLGPMATDVAIDRTLGLNAFGLRSLYVLAGPAYFDVNDPAPIPQPAGPPMGQGLSFLNHPASNLPGATCTCPGTIYPAVSPTTNSVMSFGNAGFGVSVAGLPPGFPVIFGFDVAGFLPFFPVINPPVGCGLGLTLSGSTLFFIGLANPLGVATFGVPMTPPSFPLGTGPIYNQNAVPCPADPFFGLVLTPMQALWSAAP